MPRRLLLHIQAGGDEQIMGKVLNFTEDLYSQIELTELGKLDDIDRYHSPIVIEVHHARQVGRVRKIIQQELRRHYLEANITVS